MSPALVPPAGLCADCTCSSVAGDIGTSTWPHAGGPGHRRNAAGPQAEAELSAECQLPQKALTRASSSAATPSGRRRVAPI